MKEKKSLKDRITTRNEAIAGLREQQEVIFANIGQLLVENEADPDDELKALFGSVEDLAAEIRNLEESLRRVLSDGDRRRNLDNELAQKSEELKSIRIKQEAAAEDVGHAAWDLWQSGRLTGTQYQEALAGLIDADEKQLRAEESLHRLKTAKNLLAKGKQLIVRSRKKLAAAALNRQFGPAGMKFVEIEDRADFDGTRLVSLLAAYDALAAQQQEIAAAETRLKSERDMVSAEFQELPGKGSVTRRQSFLEKTIEDKRSELDALYRNLGRAWFESADGGKTDPELRLRRNEIEETERKIVEKEEEKQALRARVDLLELESRRAEKYAAYERLETEIKQKQAMLKDRKKEMNSLDKEINSLRESLPPEPAE